MVNSCRINAQHLVVDMRIKTEDRSCNLKECNLKEQCKEEKLAKLREHQRYPPIPL